MTATATITLTEFLEQRIQEDEAVARNATPGRWHVDEVYSTVTAEPFKSAREAYDRANYDVDCWVIPESMDSGVGMHNLEHYHRHDPARVLAECERDRRILARFEQAQRLRQANIEAQTEASRGGVANQEQTMALRRHGYELQGRLDGLRFAVEAMAAVYSDHPSWRAEWAL